MVDVDRCLKLGDHESLCELLCDSPDPAIRQRAAEALGELLNRNATPTLTRALSDNIWEVSHAAASALESIGEPALPGLEEALQGPSDEVRNLAARTICAIGGPATFELLQRLLLEAPGDMVRITAAQALADTREPFTRSVLTRALEDHAWEVRRLAAQGLGRLGEKASLEALDQRLEVERNGKVQTALRTAIEQLGLL